MAWAWLFKGVPLCFLLFELFLNFGFVFGKKWTPAIPLSTRWPVALRRSPALGGWSQWLGKSSEVFHLEKNKFEINKLTCCRRAPTVPRPPSPPPELASATLNGAWGTAGHSDRWLPALRVRGGRSCPHPSLVDQGERPCSAAAAPEQLFKPRPSGRGRGFHE